MEYIVLLGFLYILGILFLNLKRAIKNKRYVYSYSYCLFACSFVYSTLYL